MKIALVLACLVLITAVVGRRRSPPGLPAPSAPARENRQGAAPPPSAPSEAAPRAPDFPPPSLSGARGRVRTVEGVPIAGAWVSTLEDPFMGRSTDAQGRFTLEAPGKSLVIRAKGWGTTVHPAGPGETEIVLAPPGAVAIRPFGRREGWRLERVEGARRVVAASGILEAGRSRPLEVAGVAPGPYVLVGPAGAESALFLVQSGERALAEPMRRGYDAPPAVPADPR